MEFTILGDTVNTASRLPALSKQEATMVLLTGDTAAACQGRHDIVPLGEMTVRGRHAPLRHRRPAADARPELGPTVYGDVS